LFDLEQPQSHFRLSHLFQGEGLIFNGFIIFRSYFYNFKGVETRTTMTFKNSADCLFLILSQRLIFFVEVQINSIIANLYLVII